MNISDIIRERTYTVRDTLGTLDRNILQAKSDRDSAEERRKRTTTEISRQHDLERAARHAANEILNKTKEIRQKLEEIDRQRQEAIDLLFQCQEDQTRKEKDLQYAREATELALSDFTKEEKAKQEAEARVFQMQSEKEANLNSLCQKLQEALASYLLNQVEQLQKAFFTEEQRTKERREQEDFQKARHSDAEIAALWDQRQELLKLSDAALVPAVKQMLQSSLEIVEDTLKKKHPGASFAGTAVFRYSQIEELLYYLNSQGQAVLLLPILETDWNRVTKGENDDRTSRIMCFIWNMIHDLGLKEEDGRFSSKDACVAFETCLGLEDIAILQDFGIKCEGSEILRFKLTAMSAELQEVVNEEN
jgi:DNA repair exonuclease SbcCD ATPase subunit